MKEYIILLSLLILAGCALCENKQNGQNKKVQEKMVSNHYIATDTRKKIIIDHWQEIQAEMNQDQVKGLLGEPDQILSVYDHMNIFSKKTIGVSYWYFLERKGGNYAEDALVRIIFNLSGQVETISQWGF
jgi:hypothetical protein